MIGGLRRSGMIAAVSLRLLYLLLLQVLRLVLLLGQPKHLPEDQAAAATRWDHAQPPISAGHQRPCLEFWHPTRSAVPAAV